MREELEERILKLVQEALQLSPRERAAFLERHWREDPGLWAEVESKIHLHEQRTADTIEPPDDRSPPGPGSGDDDQGTRTPDRLRDPLVGQKIGKYLIKRLIGRGGMGRVFLAVEEQTGLRVGLKILQPGTTSESRLRRFEFEWKAMARLRHPGIAYYHDRGFYDDGDGPVPYFVMEYVPNARPITDYVTQKDFGLRQRLELFIEVCDAVYHGDQKGIIHRDLKPSNILIDSSGRPKIIDFGVARVADPEMAGLSIEEGIAQIVGTLQYMSPEQFERDSDDLDCRSDVYSLGMVLFELLCRELPYDLTRASVHEAARVIREDPPIRPSSINHVLRGDLETIALKALDKDRDRRYRSAADLADDVRRFLRDEPVQAMPPSFTYKLRKFARRHKAGVGSTVAVSIALIAGLVASLVLLQQARTARTEAQTQRDRADRRYAEARDLANFFMDDVHEEIVELPGTLEARQMLVDRALQYLQKVEQESTGDVEVQLDIARGRRLIAQILGGRRGSTLGRTSEAMEQLEEARRLHESIATGGPADGANLLGLAATHLQIGDVLRTEGDRDGARIAYETALQIVEESGKPVGEHDGADRLLAIILLQLGDEHRYLGDAEEARRYYERSLDVRVRRADRTPDDQTLRELTVIQTRLGRLFMQQGQLDEARRYYDSVLLQRLALAQRLPESARRQRDVMNAHKYVASVLAAQEKWTEADSNFEKALHLARSLAEAAPQDQRAQHDLASALRLHGNCLANAGLLEAALQRFEEARPLYEALADTWRTNVEIQDELAQVRQAIQYIRESGLDDTAN